jgi:hypothetical protein
VAVEAETTRRERFDLSGVVLEELPQGEKALRRECAQCVKGAAKKGWGHRWLCGWGGLHRWVEGVARGARVLGCTFVFVRLDGLGYSDD